MLTTTNEMPGETLYIPSFPHPRTATVDVITLRVGALLEGKGTVKNEVNARAKSS